MNMLGFKIVVYSFIFLSSSLIGILISKKYENREKELKEFKSALNIFKTKIQFTYEPIPEIFKEIARSIDTNVGNIFRIAGNGMQKYSAEIAWNRAIDIRTLNVNSEDIEILKNLGKLLGKTDVQGQVNQIDLTSNFIDEQITKAGRERLRNEKLYRTLGMIAGLTIVIVLM